VASAVVKQTLLVRLVMVPLSWLLVRWGRVTLSGLCMVVGEAEIQMVPHMAACKMGPCDVEWVVW